MALPLIDKLDSFELVRDQIAGILVAEVANQRTLATAALKDPLDYTLNVYLERDFPVDRWLNSGVTDDISTAPIVSVWMEQSSINMRKTSNANNEQSFDVVYNLDVMARGFSSDVGAGGYSPADRAARIKCHSAVRLVRNILAHPNNSRLGLPSIVHSFPQFENFELGPAPLDTTEPNISIWNCRCRFRVPMQETTLLAAEVPLELIRIDVSDDGGVVFAIETS